jgi:hypothetical protein
MNREKRATEERLLTNLNERMHVVQETAKQFVEREVAAAYERYELFHIMEMEARGAPLARALPS